MKKIVAITGITKGLGFALMSCFIKDEWQIIGCGRSGARIDQLKELYGNNHYFEALDVSNPHAVESWIASSINEIGTPSIIINNAGIINKPNPLWKISDDEFLNVINVNLMGAFFVMKYFIPNLINAKNALIINISSSWGREAEKYLSPYCASKFALEGLTKSLADELPKNITAVTLDPGGGVNTDMLQLCMPNSAPHAPSPDQWAQKAYRYIIGINPTDNGKALTLDE